MLPGHGIELAFEPDELPGPDFHPLFHQPGLLRPFIRILGQRRLEGGTGPWCWSI